VNLIPTKLIASFALTMLSGGAFASQPPAQPVTRASTPPLVVIVKENHEYGTIVGSRYARYLNRRFISHGTLFTNYHALHHPSLPNYLDMTSGKTSGCSSDSCPRRTYRTNNIFHQLSTAGIGWRSWQESMPSRCALDSSGNYAVKHNPAPYYRDLFPRLCRRYDVPYPSSLPSALKPFTFITPNLCHDMHDCSVATGDHWLRRHVPALLDLGAVVVITFDEGTTNEGGGGHVMTAVSGPGVASGTRDRRKFNHYGLLAGIEKWFGVRRLNGAASNRPLPLG
jgi:hypothetical protein